MAPPSAPAAPPTPTTVETVVEGNMSVGVAKRFADHPWWAAVASENSAMAGHGLVVKMTPKYGTKRMGTTSSAQMSMADLRPALTVWPHWMIKPESQPPPMDPTVETL